MVKRKTTVRRRATQKANRSGVSLKVDRTRKAKKTTRSLKKWKPAQMDLMLPKGRARKGKKRTYRRFD